MRPTRGGASRVPVLVALGFLVSGAFVVEQSRDDAASPPATVLAGADPVVTPADRLSSAWYCAGGTAVDGGRADETVIVTNVGDADAPVRITVTAEAGVGPVVQELVVAARASARLRLADVIAASEPGVTVEVFGGRVLVEHEVRGRDDVAVSPCADDASTTWYFAGGTTLRGTEQWLEVYNPFPDDAVVTVRFLTPAGERGPQGTRDLVVSGRSRRSIPIHAELPREPWTGMVVEATAGRVVADRTLVHTGTEGLEGLALTLGQPRPTTTATFAGLQLVAGRSASLAVGNPSDTDAIVTIEVRPTGGVMVPPLSEQLVPPGALLVLDLAAVLPPDTWAGLVVDATGSAPVVAEVVQESRLPDPDDGLEVLRPGVAGSEWVAVAELPDLAELVAVSVLNPGPDVATVTFEVLGTASDDPGLVQVLQPGEVRVVQLPTALVVPTTAAPTTAAPTTAAPTTAAPTTAAPTTTAVPETTTVPETATTVDPSGSTTTTADASTTTTVADATTTTTVPETTTTTVPPTTTTTGPPFVPALPVHVPVAVTPGGAVIVRSDAPVVVLRVLVGRGFAAAATAVAAG